MQRCSALVNCEPESCSRVGPSGPYWNQHESLPSTRDVMAGIRERILWQHRRRSNDEEHPEQHRVKRHDHLWKSVGPINICHLERWQHPPQFAECHEGNWTEQQPRHRQGGGRSLTTSREEAFRCDWSINPKRKSRNTSMASHHLKRLSCYT